MRAAVTGPAHDEADCISGRIDDRVKQTCHHQLPNISREVTHAAPLHPLVLDGKPKAKRPDVALIAALIDTAVSRFDADPERIEPHGCGA
jgi:hypothetical protein